MKKRVLLIIVALIIILNFVSSLEQVDQLKENVDKIEDVKDTLEDEDARAAYLQEKWNSFLQNNPLGKALSSLEKSIKKIDPVIKFIFGIEFSLSFLFILNLVIWIFLLMAIYRLLQLEESAFDIIRKIALIIFVPMSPETAGKLIQIKNKIIKYIIMLISLISVIILANIKVPSKLSLYIISFIKKIPSMPLQIIVSFFIFILFIIILILLNMTKRYYQSKERAEEYKKLKEDLRDLKEKKEYEEDEDERTGKEILKAVGRAAREE